MDFELPEPVATEIARRRLTPTGEWGVHGTQLEASGGSTAFAHARRYRAPQGALYELRRLTFADLPRAANRRDVNWYLVRIKRRFNAFEYVQRPQPQGAAS